jgi:hypothetical protein
MRILLILLASITFLSSGAQTYLPPGSMGYAQWQPFRSYMPIGDSSHLNQKWYLMPYAAISAGIGFGNGVGATMISAPVGIQLNHPLNNNLVAFAGVSVAPTFFNFNSAFTSQGLNASYPGGAFPNAYGFGLNTRVEMGLMYINDAKTFSISGSIGVERGSYPIFPSYPGNRTNTKRQ